MNLCRPFHVFGLVLAVVVLGQPALGANKPLGDLTGPWQLFLDDGIVASKSNVQRHFHAFTKHKGNPLLVVDKPWERDVLMGFTVLPNADGSGYRMYYASWAPENDPDGGYTCLATSKDGIQWEKPNLGLHKWKVDGKTDNNIIPGAGVYVMHTPWEKDPEKQYYSVTQEGGNYFTSYSPDGLRWKQLTKDPVIQGGDTGHFYWDPNTKLFRCTVKGGATDKIDADIGGTRRRTVGYSETSDPAKFPPLRLIMTPDDIDDLWCKPGTVQRTHFYACPVIPYETMYVGLLQIYRAEEPEGYFHGPLWLELVSSRDGMHWLRAEPDTSVKGPYTLYETSRPPLLNLGKFREFDDGMVFATSLVVVGDEIRMYYTGYDELHDLLPYSSCIGLATLRKDGFASLDADEVPGEVLTCRFAGASGPLQVNCDPRGGSVRVEVLDGEGRVIPGYGRGDCEPLTANRVRQTVNWKTRKELPSDSKELRFRFVLDRARVFSFMAGDNAKALSEPGPTPLQALFTFEGQADAWADTLGADGVQKLRNLGTSRLDHKKPDPAFGKRSLWLTDGFRPLNRVEIIGTEKLGRHFTLAAMVKHTSGKPARLFSSYNGNFPVATSELIFDFDPQGRVISGLRLVCKGIAVESDHVTFNDRKYHHLAVTYDDGRVTFYLDGKQIGEQWIPGGEPVELVRNLMIGEDLNMGTNEQLTGNADDVLVLGWALPADQIKALAEKGAEAVLLTGAK